MHTFTRKKTIISIHVFKGCWFFSRKDGKRHLSSQTWQLRVSPGVTVVDVTRRSAVPDNAGHTERDATYQC